MMLLRSKVLAGAGMALAVMAGAVADASAQNSFRIALGDAAGSAQHVLALKFVEEVEARTNGEYTAELFPNGQLGDEQATVNDASMGLLDMSLVAINNITPFSPTVGIFTLPYVIRDVDEAQKLIHSEIGQEATENTIRDAGVRILAWTSTGCRRLTNSKRPVETLEDLQGLVIRVPKNEIMIDSYNAWGINPTPMAWSETFTALQQGVVDGQDNPYLTIHSMKFYEVQDYITDICYVFSIEPLIIGEGLFQSLEPELQEALLAAGEAATEYSAQFLRDKEEEIKEDLVAKGMEITQPANDEQQWIEKATSAVWPKHYDSIGGKEKLDRAMEILGRSS